MISSYLKKIGWLLIPISLLLLNSCNLFNVIADAKPPSDDADALILEGQIYYRNAEYKEASRYFEKAIKIDSTKSEAWFGLAKAALFANNINPFTLITYINIPTGEIPFMNVEKKSVVQLYEGMEAAVAPLRELIRRDTLTYLYEKSQKNKKSGSNLKQAPLSDRKIQTEFFSASYAVVEVSHSLLRFRYKNLNSNAMLALDPDTKELSINLDSLKNDPEYQKELAESLKELASDIVTLQNVVLPIVTEYISEGYSDSLEHSLLSQDIEKMINEHVEDLGAAIDNYIETQLNPDETNTCTENCDNDFEWEDFLEPKEPLSARLPLYSNDFYVLKPNDLEEISYES